MIPTPVGVSITFQPLPAPRSQPTVYPMANFILKRYANLPCTVVLFHTPSISLAEVSILFCQGQFFPSLLHVFKFHSLKCRQYPWSSSRWLCRGLCPLWCLEHSDFHLFYAVQLRHAYIQAAGKRFSLNLSLHSLTVLSRSLLYGTPTDIVQFSTAHRQLSRILDTASLTFIGHLVYYYTIKSVAVLLKFSRLHLLTSLKGLCDSISIIAGKGYLVCLIHVCISFRKI